MERYICVHGHFYQPPRENAWLEAIEVQDSAYPFHDWNERITAECYAPNSAARILDAHGKIDRIVNNYAKISFNFGPTLLTWLEEEAPDIYQAILEADRSSQERYSGHGSALAQAYNHIIMPLANRRDRVTQVIWGIRDFEHRFGRSPEGMWLPETAADLETLEVLAEAGIKFTILSPYQAARVRQIGSTEWHDVAGGQIDPKQAYRVALPSGRSLAIFFYDGPISRAVAFEQLLSDGERFAQRLLGGFHEEERDRPQLVHIATDGETYGHHHRYGEMALAYALDYCESRGLAKLTNYGEYLERFPPEYEVDIFENSSWSCVHGVERWRSDCGCNTGGHQGWSQQWRGPLRGALDWLRDTIEPEYEAAAATLFADPWQVRNDYVNVILDRSETSVRTFFEAHARPPFDRAMITRGLKLLELQRQLLLMYTSCGWFFSEVTGIETTQILQYAARAIQLAEQELGLELEPEFLERLSAAKSNLPEYGDAAKAYGTLVRPSRVNLLDVAAHYAISSLFQSYQDVAEVYAFTIERHDYRSQQAGRAKVAIGQGEVRSNITWESADVTFGALHLGVHAVSSGVRESSGVDDFAALEHDVEQAFTQVDLAEVVRVFDRYFGSSMYSLKSLFRDEQRQILASIMDASLEEAETSYRHIYENNAPLMRFLLEIRSPLPPALRVAAETMLDAEIRRALAPGALDTGRISRNLEEAQRLGIRLTDPGLTYAFEKTISHHTQYISLDEPDVPLLLAIQQIVELSRLLPDPVDLWNPQNTFYALMQQLRDRFKAHSPAVRRISDEWLEQFFALGDRLGVQVGTMKAQIEELKTEPSVAAIAQISKRRRIPSATYRLQLSSAFTFRDAQAIVPYLNDLGVTDCYLSPILQAQPGSSHGYDVCNHRQLNVELGTREDFEAFVAEAHAHNMGIVVDLVPNHVGIGDASNEWWQDILENGPSSIYASYLDIDWHPVKPEMENKVLLPILEDQYGKVLESGKLRLAYQDGAFAIYYYDSRLPVSPDTYGRILGYKLEALIERLGEQDERVQELQSILTALSYLPPTRTTTPRKVTERAREKEVIKRRIANLVDSSPDVRDAIEASIEAFNGTPGEPRSFDLLDDLLSAQPYRPAFWRVAAEEINYRRFFDINQLAAIRIERPEVFKATHDFILDLAASGKITGLRIDHPDGLWDPAAYFLQLQETYVRKSLEQQSQNDGVEQIDHAFRHWLAAEQRHPGQTPWPLYTVAEKILSENEPLPQDWAVYGTTGYNFLNDVNGIFVDRRQRQAFDRIYQQFTGLHLNFRNLANSTKKMIMLVSLASEINALAHRLERVAERNRWYRDFTLNSLAFAIREVIAALPVYRTYITERTSEPSERDRKYIEAAIAEARRRNPRTAEAIFTFIQDTLLLRNINEFESEDRQEIVEFIMKFQQVSSPVMAKGAEDTAFYIFNRLVSLNEVGGDPSRFGVPVSVFHQQNLYRQEHWPSSMLATSTHDTKRAEDVRARLNVLSEIPDEWRTVITRWARLNERHKQKVDGELAPDRNDEYLLYQTLVGAWPFIDVSDVPSDQADQFAERITQYMLKATKEAKVHTSWINPNDGYDAAVQQFVYSILKDPKQSRFVGELRSFTRRVAFFGRINSLAQLLLKLTSPGVPDIYQGTELWTLDLVDPDNRRPVDFEVRRNFLADLHSERQLEPGLAPLASELLANSEDGRIKLYILNKTLEYRRDNRRLFTEGSYEPLESIGANADHVCAYFRRTGSTEIVVIVPRLVVGLTQGKERMPIGQEVWQDTQIRLSDESQHRRFRHLFTDELVEATSSQGAADLYLAEALRSFPVAILVAADRQE